MRPRLALAAVILLLLAPVALLRLSWEHGLGGFATSPQTVEVDLGRAAVVGGGRALVGYRAHEGEEATITVRCREERRREALRSGQALEAVCGVDLHLISLWPAFEDQPPSAFFEVIWEE